jgi:hypothetical protein
MLEVIPGCIGKSRKRVKFPSWFFSSTCRQFFIVPFSRNIGSVEILEFGYLHCVLYIIYHIIIPYFFHKNEGTFNIEIE